MQTLCTNNNNSELHLAASGRFHHRWNPGSGAISVNETLWEGVTEEPGRLQSMGSQRTGQDLEEKQAGIKIAWRNINILRYADDTTLMAESEEVH